MKPGGKVRTVLVVFSRGFQAAFLSSYTKKRHAWQRGNTSAKCSMEMALCSVCSGRRSQAQDYGRGFQRLRSLLGAGCMATEGSPILGMLAGCCLHAEGSADPPRDVTALVCSSAFFPTWCRALLDVQSHPEGNGGFSTCFLWCRPY